MTDFETPQPATQNIYVQPAPVAQSNGLGIASLVLGILALLIVWIPIVGMIDWILAPLGLVLGLVGLGRPHGKGIAIAGAVCSGVALLGCIGWLVLFAIAAAAGAAAADG